MKKASYLHWFSLHEWKELTEKGKEAHSPFHYYGCIKTHSNAPVSRQLMRTCETHEINIKLPRIKPGTSRNPLSDITKRVFNEFNSQFKSITGVDFADAHPSTKSQTKSQTKKRPTVSKKKKKFADNKRN